ncbi:MAG: ATP-dependent Clp protease adaptor ClpS [Fimbriimonadaceae bacterium]|nr:ATP-dependent Clp protease adaptor ClpS [Fimbriimonadaceae bacterium]
MSLPTLEPIRQDSHADTSRWMVIIYNNRTNTMDEVVEILMRATGCDAEEAYIEMWEAHTYGKASVHFESRRECERVAEVIASIGVKTEVTPEWMD